MDMLKVVTTNLSSYTVIVAVFILLLTFIYALPAAAHSGRTDAYGGHNCYVGSCAGTYHYHNGGYDYVEPEYAAPSPYDQGHSYGSGEALDRNRDYIVERSKNLGATAGFEDGSNGKAEDIQSSVYESFCDDIEFDFREGEYQEYVDGVYDGFTSGCYDLASGMYGDAYRVSYVESKDVYDSNLAYDAQEEADDTNEAASDEGSNSGWLWLAAFASLYVIPGIYAFFEKK